MNRSKVLVVEDETRIANYIVTTLRANDYAAIVARNGREALNMLTSHCPEIIILDLGLPDMDGLEIIRSARSWSQIPIVVVSARMHEQDKIEALDAGADDYITKPFSTGELLARLRTALRHARSAANNLSVSHAGIYKAKELEIDYNRRLVTLSGERVHLTQNEYKIVSLLAMHAGKVLTYDYILKELWGPGSGDNNQVLRVHMANIRRKLEKNPTEPEYIITEMGVGYCMIEFE